MEVKRKHIMFLSVKKKKGKVESRRLRAKRNKRKSRVIWLFVSYQAQSGHKINFHIVV